MVAVDLKKGKAYVTKTGTEKDLYFRKKKEQMLFSK